jgi:hypothetical protein
MRAICPKDLMSLSLITLTMLGEESKLRSSSLCNIRTAVTTTTTTTTTMMMMMMMTTHWMCHCCVTFVFVTYIHQTTWKRTFPTDTRLIESTLTSSHSIKFVQNIYFSLRECLAYEDKQESLFKNWNEAAALKFFTASKQQVQFCLSSSGIQMTVILALLGRQIPATYTYLVIQRRILSLKQDHEQTDRQTDRRGLLVINS